MKRPLQILVLIPLFLIVVQKHEMQAQRPMHEIHSMLIFNFIKYIEWPEATKSGDFVIMIYGDDALLKQLNSFYGSKPIKGQNVKVVGIKDAAEITRAHVVYLSDNKSGAFVEVLTKTSGKPILMITDRSGLGEKGANINFKTVGGKLKFEVNKAAFSKNQLKISNQLVSMGIVI